MQSHQQTFQTISPQWLQSLTLHLCSYVRSRARLCCCPADVCDSACLCFAGSQQSQDQTSRRSGNTGEKHNENGVRLKNIFIQCNAVVTWWNWDLTLPIKCPNLLKLSVKQTSFRVGALFCVYKTNNPQPHKSKFSFNRFLISAKMHWEGSDLFRAILTWKKCTYCTTACPSVQLWNVV